MTTSENFWDEHLLWAKSLSYMDQALKQDRTSWLFPFWATLSLDFLARSALAHVSPTLLASTKTAGEATNNLFYALGYPKRADPKSIDSTEVFSRCERMIDSFSAEHRVSCGALLDRRNEELHSGGAPFNDLKDKTWLPQFYECCSILLASIERPLEDLLGPEEAVAALAMIKSANDEAAKSVKGDIAAARKIWLERPEQERTDAVKLALTISDRSLGHVVDCPACSSKALLYGEEVSSFPNEVNGDEIITKSTILPTRFECKACGLTIKGHNRLHHVEDADLGSTFTRTRRFDVADYYNLVPAYEEDYNE